MTDLTIGRLRRSPSRPRPAARPLPPEPVAAAEEGVELSRLLALARLTAAQALEIGAGVLAVAEASGGPVDPRVTARGEVVAGAGAGGRPVATVLTDVAAAARLPRPAGGGAGRGSAELDRAVGDLPADGLPVVARRLQEAAATADRAAVQAELAALVRAAGTVPGGRAAGTTAAGAAAGAPPTPATPRPAGRRAGRRAGAWVLSVLLLAAVVTAEVVVLRDDIAADIDLLLDAGRDGADPSSGAPQVVEPELPAPAPAAAGAVAAVDLRPLAACSPGAPCTLRLLVRLVPDAEPQTVTWSYRVVDRCTGAASTAPGGSVTVPSQAGRAVAVGTVDLPPAAAVAVFAVTEAPAAAASAPVVAGSCTPPGPGG
ncbi:hypothetical protein [Blastococcus sp. SYSU D00695]